MQVSFCLLAIVTCMPLLGGCTSAPHAGLTPPRPLTSAVLPSSQAAPQHAPPVSPTGGHGSYASTPAQLPVTTDANAIASQTAQAAPQQPLLIRAQSPSRLPETSPANEPSAWGVQQGQPLSTSGPMPISGGAPARSSQYLAAGDVEPVQYVVQPQLPPPTEDMGPPIGAGEIVPGYVPYYGPGVADLQVDLIEGQTGRFMIGAGVNSDLGVTGQIVLQENNFDYRRVPGSWDDVFGGRAFRGGGQSFRLEAMPGTEVQRYLASFTNPYFLDTQFSFSLSGSYFQRSYFDWDEQRLSGRIGFGYRLVEDLSLSTALSAEQVEISDPRVLGVQELDEALGNNDLFTAEIALIHDNRNSQFAPTEGRYLRIGYTQGFGEYIYPRADMEYRKYFLLYQRPDGSGSHTLQFRYRLGFTGSNTPIFERYQAGGHSTFRGFEFRGASPKDMGVAIGGDFLFLGTVEYMAPLTANDMVKGVVFCDFGTVEENVEISSDTYRVAIGTGLRITIPAMGMAPIALDFAIPVAHADTDNEQIFSFFIGVGG